MHMPREKVIGSYLLRLTDDGGSLRVRLQDLREGEPIEFETWIAAWAYLDGLLHDPATCRQHALDHRRQE